MDWLKELLKKLGVEESKIDGAIADAGKEIPKHFVPKSQYNDLSETKKKLEKDITDRDTQLEALSKDANASEALKAEITKLQDANKTAKEQYDADLKEMALNNAITTALNGKVHNEKVVTGLIDKGKLVIGDDGKVVGLDDQLKVLQTSDAYLFKTRIRAAVEASNLKGRSLLDGKDQSRAIKVMKVGYFGKQLAESTKGNEGLDTARESYFK